jgi:hypothetical protein
MIFAMSGCTWNKRKALENTVTAKSSTRREADRSTSGVRLSEAAVSCVPMHPQA